MRKSQKKAQEKDKNKEKDTDKSEKAEKDKKDKKTNKVSRSRNASPAGQDFSPNIQITVDTPQTSVNGFQTLSDDQNTNYDK